MRPIGHWQRHLATELRRQGHHVFYPQYPNTQEPVFAEWSWLLAQEIELMLELRGDSEDEIIVVGHSLGNVNFLKSALAGLLPEGFRANRVLFVAPPDPAMIDKLPDFGISASQAQIRSCLQAVSAHSTLVGSDNDLWSPRGIQTSVGDLLGLQALIIPGAKHLSNSDGWGRWQGVIDWVNDPDADLTKR